MNRQRGMVLIAVLWVVLILSILSFSLAAAVRAQAESERNALDSEKAFFMAQGAAQVVYSKFAAKQDFPEDSPVVMDKGGYIFPFENGQARVRFESADGLVDLNAAADRLLAAVFDSLGVSEIERNRIVDSILDWRDSDDIPHLYGAEVRDYVGLTPPRNAGFANLDELLLVKNMTPELFYGTVTIDSVSGEYRRKPGLRDLLTVHTGRPEVNPNSAPQDVLRALPMMTLPMVDMVLEERERKPFASVNDVVERLPVLRDHEALPYMTFEPLLPLALVSRATIKASGVTRTVRLLFRREEKIQYITLAPLLFKKVEQIVFDRWQFQ